MMVIVGGGYWRGGDVVIGVGGDRPMVTVPTSSMARTKQVGDPRWSRKLGHWYYALQLAWLLSCKLFCLFTKVVGLYQFKENRNLTRCILFISELSYGQYFRKVGVDSQHFDYPEVIISNWLQDSRNIENKHDFDPRSHHCFALQVYKVRNIIHMFYYFWNDVLHYLPWRSSIFKRIVCNQWSDTRVVDEKFSCEMNKPRVLLIVLKQHNSF